MHRPSASSAAWLILVATTLAGVPAATAAEATSGAALAPGAYEAEIAVASESPYATGRQVHPAIIRFWQTDGGGWRLGVRIFHDYLRPEAHEDLVLRAARADGPFAAADAMRAGFFSFYYSRPEAMALSSGAPTTQSRPGACSFSLELLGRRGSRGLGAVTIVRALGAPAAERLRFDSSDNVLLRPVGFAPFARRVARGVGAWGRAPSVRQPAK